MPSGNPLDRLSDRSQSWNPPQALVRREIQHFAGRLFRMLVIVSALLFIGAAAFAGYESESYWQGIQRALVTVMTVGSMGHPQTVGGQITQVALIVFGVGTLFYLLGTISELLVTGHLTGLLAARRMHRQIDHLRDHYLICGFGRVGHQIARRFADAGVPFVVIDENPDVREEMEGMNVLHVDGRASDDDILCEAGIERARGVIACVDSDAENIFVTISARALRPDIEIVARAADEATEKKLIRAGANDVVSPYKASGDTMAALALGDPGARRGSVDVDINEDGVAEGRIFDTDALAKAAREGDGPE
jgi:voltage-gated potassium channel